MHSSSLSLLNLANYDKCGGGKNGLPEREQSILTLAADAFDSRNAAMMAAIWSHESGLQLTPGGDAGPAQLTTWWSTNQPNLIVGNAYGSWNGRTNQPFDGDVRDNIATLRNIYYFLRERHGSDYQAAYWYGPGDRDNPSNAAHNREEYAKDVMGRYDKLKPYFDCLKQ